MPDGVTHWCLTKGLPLPYAIAAGSLTYNYTHDLTLSMQVGAAVYAGLYTSARWLGPDIDLNGRTFNERGITGRIVQLLTLPYALLLPHRGLSHTPLIGTFLIYTPLMLVAWYFSATIHLPIICIGAFYVGAFIGDMTHIFADHDSTLKHQIENRDRYNKED